MRTSARLAVVPLAAALLLAGCGRPGTAATVDGERITDAQLATLTEELTQLSSGTVAPTGALSSMIEAPTVLRVGSENGFAFSQQQAVQLLDESAAQLQLEPWDYSDEVVTFVRQGVVLQLIGADASGADALEEITQEVGALDVDVNPRFGSWEAGAMAPAEWPWLISAAEGDTLPSANG